MQVYIHSFFTDNQTNKLKLDKLKTFLLSTAFLLLVTITGTTQEYYASLGRSKTESVILENTYSNLRMQFSLKGIYGKDLSSIEGKDFTEIYFGNGYSTGKIGTPKLPAFKKLIQIPNGAEVTVKVIGYSEEVIELESIGIINELYPVQPSLRKDQDLDKIQFHYDKKAYRKNDFQNTPLASIEVLGTMRGIRIARVEIAPVNYNPVEKTLKVYNDIEVEISFSGVNKAANELIRSKTYSPFFEPIHKVLENSYTKSVYDDHPDFTKDPVKMLIVSNRMFESTLAPLVEWKTKKGFFVEVAYTDDIGQTSAAIKTFIHEKYNEGTLENPAPTFLVLVGDVEQVPASATGTASGKKTDLYYASVDGDYFPEMYYGRLSATTTQQLENIINKILYYEQYQFEDPTYLNNATLIAGTDGTWNYNVGQPTVKYGTANHFNSDNGFSTVWGYGVTEDPNNPNNNSGYTGCYDNERISVSLINYTAHCSETSWAGPNLYISDVNSMTNTNKYPLAIGNCCLSADFGYSESIGEAWIRAQNKGAVTYVGSSPNSFWFEDFYWAVGAFPIEGNNSGYVPTFEETTFGAYDAPFNTNYVTVGGIVFTGNLAVTEVDLEGYPSHSSPLYYWEAYNILGDPSLVPYLTEAGVNTVSHMEIAPIGTDFYHVTALPNSYVAVSKNGILHGAAFVGESGEVMVPLVPILDGGDVDIVVTRPQTVPYLAQVPAAALEGPYVVLDDYTIDDQLGNDNGLADYGEEFSIDVTLINVGSDIAESISTTISGSDEYFSILSAGPISFGNILAEDGNNSSTVSGAFSFNLSNAAPDQHKAHFDMEITDGENVWNSTLSLTANAPVLGIGDLTIDDAGQGIPGVIDSGETVDVIFDVFNSGHSISPMVNATLSSTSEYITINGEASISINAIVAGESSEASFSITADNETPTETPIVLTITIEADQYQSEKQFEVILNYIPEYLMDNQTVTACIGKFYDSGGANAGYSSGESFTKTFYSAGENMGLMFNFTSFATESGYDYLYIYNGENTSAEQIEGSPFSGTATPGIVTSTNDLGALTFRFVSDGSITDIGWYADFSCVDLSVPPTCASNPYPANEAIVSNNPLELSWDVVPGALEYDVYFGENTLPAQPTATINTNSYFIDLQEYTNYVWKVVPRNNAGAPEGCETWSFSTEGLTTNINIFNGTITTCNANFFDSGGPSSNYSDNETRVLTVYPSSENTKIKVTFSAFNLESGWDYLNIYDGSTVSANQIVSLTGTTIPSSVVATNSEGVLTFEFTSDGSTVRAGWAAVLSCEGVFNVSFNIVNSQSEPITGATVTLGDYGSTPTNTSGMAMFNGVYPANGISYSITHNDFHEHEGSVDVIDQDMTIDIVMFGLSGEVNHDLDLKIYPNPFNSYIKISGTERIIRFEITDILGKVLMSNEIRGDDEVVETSRLKQGIYLIVLTFDNGERLVQRIVKQ